MIVVIKDRLIRGFAAGVLGGAVMAFFDQASVRLGISRLSYSQWAAVYTLGYLPSNFLEGMLGQIGHLMFAGFNGLLFAWIVPHKNQTVIKGVLWGLFIWFFANSVSVIFKTDLLVPKSVGTTMTDFVTAIVYGWVLAAAIKNLESRNAS